MRTNKRMIGLVSVLALAVCWAWSTAASAGLSDGLVGYWPLDEGSGTTTADLSGSGNTGSLLKGPGIGVAPQWNAGGKFGNCLSLDGISSYVDCGNGASLRPASAVTVAGWVKQSALSYYAPIAGFIYDQGSDESGYAILSWTTPAPSGYGGWIRMGTNTDGGYMPRMTTGYTLGQWTHVALTYDGSVTTLYVNGPANKQTRADTGDLDYVPENTFKMGVYQTASYWFPLAGLIDDVAVWDRALSAGDIGFLACGKTPFDEPIVLVTESDNSTAVSEEGPTSDSYQIVLAYEPNADGSGAGGGDTVIIKLDPCSVRGGDIDLGAGPGVSIKLTFTSSNWNTPKTVTVTAVNDAVIEDTHAAEVKQTIISAGDPNYANAYAPSVMVTITDNDVPKVTITESGNLTYVVEGGATDSYSISLNVLPTDNVVITLSPVVNRTGAVSGDDAEQNVGTGATVINSTDLEFVYDLTYNQTLGMRFPNITIPQGATISKAYIQFTVDEAVNNDPLTITFYGQDIDNAPLFTTGNSNISNRTKTGASVNWVAPPQWLVVGKAGTDQRTPDLKTIVQAIVNRAGWVSGNALAFIATGTALGTRIAAAWDAGVSLAPRLHIEYTYTAIDIEVNLGGGPVALPQTLTFTTANWNTARTITVIAKDDAVVEGDETVVISHTVSGTSQYAVLPPGSNPALPEPVQVADVTAYVGDNDIPSLNIEDDLVLYLPFDGNTQDRSGKSNNGLAVNDPNAVAGIVGSGAYDFDGTSNPASRGYVTCGKSEELNFGASTDFTVAAWIKMSTLSDTGDGAIMSNKNWATGAQRDGWVIDVGSDGRMEWNIGDGANRRDYDGPAGQVSMNQPHLLVVTHDRDGLSKYYLDGLPVGSGSLVGIGDIDSGLPTVIGADGTFSTVWEWFFDGNIDEPAIWNRALTIAEVLQLWNSGAGMSLPMQAGLRLAPSPADGGAPLGGSRLTVEEGGPSDTYTVALNKQPGSNVVVTVNSADPDIVVAGAPVSLTFTSVNWNTPQTITVSAFNDVEYEQGEDLALITHTCASVDAAYNGFVDTMTINVIDNDEPEVIIDPNALSIMEGDSKTYTVVLSVWPTNETGNVLIKVDPNGAPENNGAEIKLNGAGAGVAITLTFTSANWSTPKTVTVAVVENSVLTDDRSATIVHSATSVGDYNGIPIDSVAVTIEEDECGHWGYSPMDFNEDCVVDLLDLNAFINDWLICTDPVGVGCVNLIP